MTSSQLRLALLCLSLVTARHAAALGDGGRVRGVAASPIETFTLGQTAAETITLQVSDLTAGGDPVLHVLSFPDGNNIAYNDDYPGLGLGSLAQVPPVGYDRTLWIVIRSYHSAGSGDGTLTITQSFGTYSFGVSFGGTFVQLPDLNAASHVFMSKRAPRHRDPW